MTYVRVGSHRAGEKLQRALGRSLEWFYTWDSGGDLVRVTDAELATARSVKGVTKARLTSEPSKCWSMS